MNRLGWVLLVLLGALLYGVGFLHGAGYEQKNAAELDNERLRQAFDQGQAMGTVRDRIVTEYVDRVQVVEKVGRTIVKEIPVYVSPEADRACVVPAGFVRLHDAAASGVPPGGSAGAADAAPAGIALSAVTETVADNYTGCRVDSEKLIGLQRYVNELRQQQGLAPLP